MTSIRHNGDPDDLLLDAAHAAILAVGWKRTTLTDVARRAGVSRMTLYRRWPDMQTLLSDLMTREWSGVAASVGGTLAGPAGGARSRLAAGVAEAVGALRGNALFRKILDVDPELLLPYLLDRRGRTQDSILALLEAALAEGREDGSVRDGDPALLARTVLLAAHGFALSAGTMSDGEAAQGGAGAAASARAVTVGRLDAELRALVDRYLEP